MDLEIIDIGFAELDSETKDLKIQGMANLGSSYDNTIVMSALGLTSMPYPADDSGNAQMAIAKDISGVDAVCLGATDTRVASIVGNLKSGDTVLHSTGPNQSAQIQLKEDKKQACIVTKNDNLKDFGLFIDGKKNSLTLTVPGGGMISIDSDNGVVLSSESGEASIQLKGGNIVFNGNLMLNGYDSNVPLTQNVGPATTALKGIFVKFPPV